MAVIVDVSKGFEMRTLKSWVQHSSLWLLLACMALNTKATPLPAQKNESAQMVVQRLYQDYAWVVSAKTVRGKRDLIAEPESVLAQYFTDDLVKLIHQDFECARQSSEICNLDFDPIYASQDPKASNLRILGSDKNQNITVQFRYPSTGQAIQVRYKMEMVDRGWRISDICYKNTKCLRHILRHSIGK